MAFFISTRDTHISPRWYEKWHIITYLSYTLMHLYKYLWELIVFRNHSLIWDMMPCHIISTFLIYVFIDIILIQLHLYNNTRWFNEHFPCFPSYPFWQWQTTEVNKDTLITKPDRTGKSEFRTIFFFPKKSFNCEKNK